MTFRWHLGLKLTFFRQTNTFIWFPDTKKLLKVTSFIILRFFVFFFKFNYLAYFSDPWAKKLTGYKRGQLRVMRAHNNLSKKYYFNALLVNSPYISWDVLSFGPSVGVYGQYFDPWGKTQILDFWSSNTFQRSYIWLNYQEKLFMAQFEKKKLF